MNKIGNQIIRLDSVDSTNNYAAIQLRKGLLAHGAVILAVEQDAGRGQANTVWQSNAGENLTFTFFLNEVNLSVTKQFDLSCLVALAVVETLKHYGLKAQVKWPNDVLINNRKIAGILIELQVTGSMVRSAIVGVGLNVNQTDFGLLAASSMNAELGVRFSIDEVLFSYIHQFNLLIENKLLDSTALRSKYHEILVGLNQLRTFRDQQGEFEGVILGTDDRGCLIVDKQAEIKTYDLKEIEFIF